MAVSVTSILVEGEIQQNERFDQEVSFTSILAEGDPYNITFKGITSEVQVDQELVFKGITSEVDTIEANIFKGITAELEIKGGFAQIIMLNK
jgi:hypothetical protein